MSAKVKHSLLVYHLEDGQNAVLGVLFKSNKSKKTHLGYNNSDKFWRRVGKFLKIDNTNPLRTYVKGIRNHINNTEGFEFDKFVKDYKFNELRFAKTEISYSTIHNVKLNHMLFYFSGRPVILDGLEF